MHCTLLALERDIAAIFWFDSETGLQVGKDGCESLEVIHVAGQCGYVPWIQAIVSGESYLYNAAHIEGVKLVKESESDA